jgi:peptide/nickel transport system substrate-binding protein
MRNRRLPRRFGVRNLVVCGLTASLALLVGTGTGPVDAAARPAGRASADTLRIGIGIRPDNLEIARVTNTAVANLLENVVETLVTVDENGEIAPRLAERWEVSPDGREFTFHLPRGVTFQDGTPLTPDAVVWNYNRLKLEAEVIADCPAEVELAATSLKVVGKSAVRYTLTRPLPNFLASLSSITWGILSPNSENVPGNKKLDIQHPVGTGPFTFVSLTADELRLKRFEGYRGERPYFGELAFKFVPGVEEREKGLADNQLDVILLPRASQLASFAKDARYQVLSKPSTRTIFVNFNNQRAPFTDVRVRRAVNMAIDKQALIDDVLHGAGTVSDAPVAPAVFGYCSVGSYDYDPEGARALLAEAGVAPGTRLKMLTPSGRYLEDVAVSKRIAGYLRDVGLDVTVEAMEWPALMAAIGRPPEQVAADMVLSGWAPTYPDAGWQLPKLYSSKNWPPLGPAASFYRNPEVEKLIETAHEEANPRLRKDLFCTAGQALWADAPVAFLWVQSFPVAYRDGLTNIVSLPNEKISAAFARPAAAAPDRKPAAKPASRAKGKTR